MGFHRLTCNLSAINGFEGSDLPCAPLYCVIASRLWGWKMANEEPCTSKTILPEAAPQSLAAMFGMVRRSQSDVLFLLEKLKALQGIMFEMKAHSSAKRRDSLIGKWVQRMEAMLTQPEAQEPKP
jgi:hypothetical protein